MKKFLALGLLGISHATVCNPALRTDCYEDSSGEYKPAGDKVLTNLVLTKITSGQFEGKYNISDCDGSPKTWGTESHGNVVECGITADDLAPGLHLNEAYENGHVGQVVTYKRILMAPTTAMCDSLTGTALEAVCDVAGYTVHLIADADATACANTVCDANDVAKCCVSKFAVVAEDDSQSKKDARTKMVASLSGKSKGARLDWSTKVGDSNSFTVAERIAAVKLIADGEKIKYRAGTKERTVIGRTARRDEQAAKAQGNKIKQTKGEPIEFPVHTADGNDHVCVELGAVDVCFTITPANLGQDIEGVFEAAPGRRLSGATACFEDSQLNPEGDNIYSFNGAFNASNGCAITETVDSEGASQYAITAHCDPYVTTDIHTLRFSPWSTNTTCGYCHAEKGSGCTYCAEGLGFNSGGCVACSDNTVFNNAFDDTLCGDASKCPAGQGVTDNATDTADTVCAPCDSGKFIDDAGRDSYKACKPWSTCSSGQYESNTPSATVDRECGTCSNGGSSYSCGSGNYKTGTPCSGSGTSDTQGCATCTSCGLGQYKTGTTCSGSGSSDTQSCGTCTTCESGEYKTGTTCSGSETSDTQSCGTCTSCGSGQYKTGTPCSGSGTSDTQSCATCTTCGLGQHTGSPCDGTGTSDTQSPCVACPKGEYNDNAPAADTCKSCGVDKYTTDTGKDSEDDCKPCSGFSTEWINSQCCGGDLTGHCGMLNGQCDTSCR